MELLLLTSDPDAASVLPALSMLPHGLRSAAPEITALLDAGPYDAILVDARSDLAGSRSLCWLLGSAGLDVPVVVVISEGGLVTLSVDWGFDEILLPTAGPAEVNARLRLLVARRATESAVDRGHRLMLGELVIVRPPTPSGCAAGRWSSPIRSLSSSSTSPGIPDRCSPGHSCWRRSGAMTFSAAPARSMSMSGGCGPSSARSTSR
jgi:hypothetical protein